jgi:hypothetical protein
MSAGLLEVSAGRSSFTRRTTSAGENDSPAELFADAGVGWLFPLNERKMVCFVELEYAH